MWELLKPRCFAENFKKVRDFWLLVNLTKAILGWPSGEKWLGWTLPKCRQLQTQSTERMFEQTGPYLLLPCRNLGPEGVVMGSKILKTFRSFCNGKNVICRNYLIKMATMDVMSSENAHLRKSVKRKFGHIGQLKLVSVLAGIFDDIGEESGYVLPNITFGAIFHGRVCLIFLFTHY